MKNRKIIIALLAAALFALQQTAAVAQSKENGPARQYESAKSAAESSEANDIAGSWAATVYPAGGAPFAALLTFDGQGGVIGSAQGDILLDAPPDAAPSATAVHGAWKKTGSREYLFTVRQIFYSASGGFEGGNKVRNAVTLSSKGNEMSGYFSFDISDAAGNIVFSGTGTIQATRIQAEQP